jgi:hypothetical protein
VVSPHKKYLLEYLTEMMTVFIFLLMLQALFFITESINVVDITGTIIIHGAETLSNTVIALNGNQYTTLTARDGTFTFYDIPSGIYSLDVRNIYYVFSSLKIKVSFKNETSKIDVIEYKYPGAKKSASSYPIVLPALAKNSYFQLRQKFNIVSFIFGNPMVIMMIFSLGMVIVMPIMMKNMDTE